MTAFPPAVSPALEVPVLPPEGTFEEALTAPRPPDAEVLDVLFIGPFGFEFLVFLSNNTARFGRGAGSFLNFFLGAEGCEGPEDVGVPVLVRKVK